MISYACSFLCLKTKKRTKRKFKEKSNAPHFFPLLAHKFAYEMDTRVLELAAFASIASSPMFRQWFGISCGYNLKILQALHFSPSVLCDVPFVKSAKNEALENAVGTYLTFQLSLVPNSSWLPRSASGIRLKQIIPPCIIYHRKCSGEFITQRRFRRRKYSTKGQPLHQNRLCFLCYFLCTNKESRTLREWGAQRALNETFGLPTGDGPGYLLALQIKFLLVRTSFYFLYSEYRFLVRFKFYMRIGKID